MSLHRVKLPADHNATGAFARPAHERPRLYGTPCNDCAQLRTMSNAQASVMQVSPATTAADDFLVGGTGGDAIR